MQMADTRSRRRCGGAKAALAAGSFRFKKPPPVMSKAEVGVEAAGAQGSVGGEPATFLVRRSTPKDEVTGP